MHYSLLPSLLLQILIVGYSPGPANIYALTMSLKYGRKASLVMWLGLLSGFVLATSIVAVITHYIGIVIGDYVAYLKYLDTLPFFIPQSPKRLHIFQRIHGTIDQCQNDSVFYYCIQHICPSLFRQTNRFV